MMHNGTFGVNFIGMKVVALLPLALSLPFVRSYLQRKPFAASTNSLLPWEALTNHYSLLLVITSTQWVHGLNAVLIFLHIEIVWGWWNENNWPSTKQRIDFWCDTVLVLLSIYGFSFCFSYRLRSMLKCSLDVEAYWCALSMCWWVCVLTKLRAK